jgi:hypothetical protein
VFDTSWYMSRYPDVGFAELNPLWYFVEHGVYRGHAPSAWVENVRQGQLDY